MRSGFFAATAHGLLLTTTIASAHPTQRPLLGIYHYRPQLNHTEQSGTYCVTELAPLFREAVALNASATAAATTDATDAVDATSNMPTGERTRGNKPALSGKITV